MNTGRLFVLSIAAMVGLGLALLFTGNPPSAPTSLPSTDNRALIGGPFALTNHHGARVTDADFAGRYMMIYFGYTYCPDVCPVELQKMTQALTILEERLGAAATQQIQPMFITVDPERDDVDVLAQYITLFHPSMIGLTGSVTEITAAKKAYRVYAAKVDDTGAGDYLIDHSSIIFLMDPQGAYVRHFSHDSSPTDIADAVAPMLGTAGS